MKGKLKFIVPLVLLLVPFASSYLLRVMAWKLLLGREGAINWVLTSIGLVKEPVGLLVYSQAAVVITLVYVWIPFAALPIYAIGGMTVDDIPMARAHGAQGIAAIRALWPGVN